MSIQDALDRQSDADKIIIGDLVNSVYNSAFGDVLRAVVNGLKTKELNYHQINDPGRQPLSADRILGRLEGYQNLINELELSIRTAEELKRPQVDDEDE